MQKVCDCWAMQALSIAAVRRWETQVREKWEAEVCLKRWSEPRVLHSTRNAGSPASITFLKMFFALLLIFLATYFNGLRLDVHHVTKLSTRRQINCSQRRIHCHVIDCSTDRPWNLRLVARAREPAASDDTVMARDQEDVGNDVTEWSEWRWRRRTPDHSYPKCYPMDDVAGRQTVHGHSTWSLWHVSISTPCTKKKTYSTEPRTWRVLLERARFQKLRMKQMPHLRAVITTKTFKSTPIHFVPVDFQKVAHPLNRRPK